MTSIKKPHKNNVLWGLVPERGLEPRSTASQCQRLGYLKMCRSKKKDKHKKAPQEQRFMGLSTRERT